MDQRRPHNNRRLHRHEHHLHSCCRNPCDLFGKRNLRWARHHLQIRDAMSGTAKAALGRNASGPSSNTSSKSSEELSRSFRSGSTTVPPDLTTSPRHHMQTRGRPEWDCESGTGSQCFWTVFPHSFKSSAGLCQPLHVGRMLPANLCSDHYSHLYGRQRSRMTCPLQDSSDGWLCRCLRAVLNDAPSLQTLLCLLSSLVPVTFIAVDTLCTVALRCEVSNS